MAAISAQEVQTFAALMQRAARQASAEATRRVRAYISSHPDATPQEVRDFAIAAVDQCVREYGAAAAAYACDLYDLTMLSEGLDLPRAELWDGDFRAEVEKAVRYQLEKLLAGDVGGFLDAIDEMTGYYVRGTANRTTMQNAQRDNRWVMDAPGRGMAVPTAERADTRKPSNYARRRSRGDALQPGDVAYARVPTGAETCTYCMMLASRGFAYRSMESAGHADHRGCNCLIVAGVHGSTTIEGMDASEQYAVWREFERIDRAVLDGRMTKEEAEAEKKRVLGEHPKAVSQLPEGAVRKTQSNAEMGRGSNMYVPRKDVLQRGSASRPAPAATTEREQLVQQARAIYVERGGDMGLSREQAAERFDLLVDGNTDAQLRKYIQRHK